MESTAQGMAEILSQQYESAFSSPVELELDTTDQPANHVEDVTFTEDTIIKAIDEISNSAAPGPDGG